MPARAHAVCVATPLQALAAGELMLARGWNPADVEVLEFRPRGWAGELLERTVDRLFRACGNRRVFDADASVLARLLEHRRLVAWPLASESIAIGSYQLASMRDLAMANPGAEIVVVDDGSMAPLLLDYRYGNREGPYLSGQANKRWRKLLQRLAGVRGQHPPQVTFFSIYDLPVEAPDQLERNRFENIRREEPEGAHLSTDELLVGSSAVEVGIVTEEVYEGLVDWHRSQSKGPLVYRPHRREDPARVARLAARVGLEVEWGTYPLELDLLDRGDRPGVLRATFSTVSDTLPLVLGDGPDFVVALPPEQLVASSARDGIRELFKRWTEAGLEVHVVGGGDPWLEESVEK